MDAVHPDDRETAFSFVRDAHAQQSEYTLRHRLRHADGRYVWVVGGAVPSFGPRGIPSSAILAR
ncbi:PAS domain-containing protein [Methylobacterium phyllosphaerae]